jgi:carnitine 3-dehydrogenase
VRVTTQLLEGEGKRLHLFSRLFGEDGTELATGEQMLLHVSLQTRRASPPGEALQRTLAAIQAKHAALPRPGRLRCGIRD